MSAPVLVTGGSGLLALNWALTLRARGVPVSLGLHHRTIALAGVTAAPIDLASADAVARALDAIGPRLVVHSAGMTSVEGCEANPAQAHQVNVVLAEHVAMACAARNIPLVQISTDHLGPGDRSMADEDDPIGPRNIYAATKAEAENRVLAAHPGALVARTNFYAWGPAYRPSFSERIVVALRQSLPITLFTDVYFTPILAESLVDAVHELVHRQATGVFHVVGDERLSKYEFGLRLAQTFGLDAGPIRAGRLRDQPALVPRPADMSLSNAKTTRAIGRPLGESRGPFHPLAATGTTRLLEGTAKLMIPYGRHHIDEADIQAVVDVLRRGELTQGPTVEAFERAIADYVGVGYAVAVSSCTAGLHLAALAAGVGPGTALVTSPITFVASANAALYAGARPLFCDVDAATVNMCADSLRQVLAANRDVRAVVPVHFSGLPCDMPAIKRVADEAGAVVIEDAAHALGARYADGGRVGSCQHSLMTVFSFHPVKAIASGEGGMITTNDESIYRQLLRLRSHGINKLDDALQVPEQASTDGVRDPWYYEMQEVGFHYRITDIQCALGLSQFAKLEAFLDRRRALVKAYDAAFAGGRLVRPAQAGDRDSSGHHIYVLRVDFAGAGTTRAAVMRELRSRGIVTQVHYIPVQAHPHYRRLGHRPETCPVALAYYQQALTIPLFVDLTDSQQAAVISSVQELIR